MDKELEKQLLEKILKYIEKYPLEQWTEHYDYDVYYRSLMSPDNKVAVSTNDGLVIKLNPVDENVDKRQSFYSFKLPLAENIENLFEKEKERRASLLLLERQKKEKRALDEF